MIVATLLAAILPAPAESAPQPFHPSRLAHLGDSRQVVVVTSSGWKTSHATLRAYRLDKHGTWHLRFGPWPARVGYAGMVRGGRRIQDTGTTPAGTFRMLSGFGSLKDPGTRLESYTQIDKNDWWPYDKRDPSTYNVFQRSRSEHAEWRRDEAERLMHWGRGAYRYSVVLDYNLPGGVRWSDDAKQYVATEPADTRRGGGIFLHVNGKGATAGCVSVKLGRMRKLLRWLDTSKQPRIVIGPKSVIDQM